MAQTLGCGCRRAAVTLMAAMTRSEWAIVKIARFKRTSHRRRILWALWVGESGSEPAATQRRGGQGRGSQSVQIDYTTVAGDGGRTEIANRAHAQPRPVTRVSGVKLVARISKYL